MRRGELLGLKWDDINFTTGELSIKQEYTTLGSDYIISTPKTKSSVRSVHLPRSVLNILGEYRKTVNSEWVFPTHPRSAKKSPAEAGLKIIFFDWNPKLAISLIALISPVPMCYHKLGSIF